MRALGWVMVGVVGVIVLLIVGILAGHVGGIAIRKQGAESDPLQLQLSEPVVRGVPVMVRWTAPSLAEPSALATFVWRDQEREYRLGEARLVPGEAFLQFPCAAVGTSGGLVVRSASDGRVIGSRVVELTPPGPECIR